jgi:ferredoxin
VPACASACPTKAIKFGSRLRLLKYGKDRLNLFQKRGLKESKIFGVDQYGGLNVLTIVASGRDLYAKGSLLNRQALALTRALYMIGNRFSFGSDMIKRQLWKISRSITGV